MYKAIFSIDTAMNITEMMNHCFSNIVTEMIPFCCVALPLIILNVYYSKKKSEYQYKNDITNNKYTIWTGFRVTFEKVFNYISWIFLSTSLSTAFGMPALAVVIMAIIYGIDIIKMLNTHLESKGIDIDEVGLLKIVCKYIWSKITGNSDENFDDVVKKQEVKAARKRKSTKKVTTTTNEQHKN